MKQDIQKYFNELKKEDQNIPIPAFEEIISRKQNTLKRYLPLSIAASMVLVFSLIFSEKKKSYTDNQEVVILMERASSSQMLLEQDNSIYDWEPSSSFLINDFND